MGRNATGKTERASKVYILVLEKELKGIWGWVRGLCQAQKVRKIG